MRTKRLRQSWLNGERRFICEAAIVVAVSVLLSGASAPERLLLRNRQQPPRYRLTLRPRARLSPATTLWT